MTRDVTDKKTFALLCALLITVDGRPYIRCYITVVFFTFTITSISHNIISQFLPLLHRH